MPSGKIHAAATTLTALAAPLLLAPESPRALLAGCLMGLVITPDLDIARKTHAHSVVEKAGREVGSVISGRGRLIGSAVGEVLGFVWWAFWRPYGKVIPHRSFWSHGAGIGTLGRLLYLFFFPFLIWWFLSIGLEEIAPPHIILSPNLEPVLEAVWGLMIVDSLHTALDQVVSAFKS